MKLEFTTQGKFTEYYSVDEEGVDTDKVSYEHLGLIFKDELGVHWNISEDYSGIIELKELHQITKFMEEFALHENSELMKGGKDGKNN